MLALAILNIKQVDYLGLDVSVLDAKIYIVIEVKVTQLDEIWMKFLVFCLEINVLI